jgi:triosephosphate isomerase
MRQVIAGNWKMNGLNADSRALAEAIRAGATELACDLVVFPPFTQVANVAAVLAGSGIGVGGQDCHSDPSGPHTGDISAAMLRDAGADWVILGHSERRQGYEESDDAVRLRVLAAVAEGLIPIVCVGETEEQRGSGRETEVVGWQLSGSLPDDFEGLIAYEPCWAIGSGKSATVEDIVTMHGFIRQELERQFAARGRTIPILYGGSVKPDNAAAVLTAAEVGGALIGGASLVAADFLAIARAARS